MLCPFGEGVMDWTAILARSDAELYVDIRIAPNWKMPIFDPAWLAVHPDLTVGSSPPLRTWREGKRSSFSDSQSPPIERLWPLLEKGCRSFAGVDELLL